MDYGYEEYLYSKHKSTETITTYVKQVENLFAFLDLKYKSRPEIKLISNRDIKDFLKDKEESGVTPGTLNKYIAVLRNFFDYLWQTEQISMDPMYKIKRYKQEVHSIPIVSYTQLLNIRNSVLNNQSYSRLRQAIFVFSLYGLRPSDYQILKSNVEELEDRIKVTTKRRTIILEDVEAECFLDYFYHDAALNGSDYVFITKKHETDPEPVEGMTLYFHLRAICRDYHLPQLSLNDFRHAYAYHLYKEKVRTIEQIAIDLGIEENSAAMLIDKCVKLYEPTTIQSLESLENTW